MRYGEKMNQMNGYMIAYPIGAIIGRKTCPIMVPMKAYPMNSMTDMILSYLLYKTYHMFGGRVNATF